MRAAQNTGSRATAKWWWCLALESKPGERKVRLCKELEIMKCSRGEDWDAGWGHWMIEPASRKRNLESGSRSECVMLETALLQRLELLVGGLVWDGGCCYLEEKIIEGVEAKEPSGILVPLLQSWRICVCVCYFLLLFLMFTKNPIAICGRPHLFL